MLLRGKNNLVFGVDQFEKKKRKMAVIFSIPLLNRMFKNEHRKNSTWVKANYCFSHFF